MAGENVECNRVYHRAGENIKRKYHTAGENVKRNRLYHRVGEFVTDYTKTRVKTLSITDYITERVNS